VRAGLTGHSNQELSNGHLTEVKLTGKHAKRRKSFRRSKSFHVSHQEEKPAGQATSRVNASAAWQSQPGSRIKELAGSQNLEILGDTWGGVEKDKHNTKNTKYNALHLIFVLPTLAHHGQCTSQ